MTEEVWDHPVFATREEFEERLKDVLSTEQEMCTDEQWWYLSFADGEEFLGGVFIQAAGGINATVRASELGINPGGQVLMLPIDAEDMGKYVPETHRNRLLTQEEVDECE